MNKVILMGRLTRDPEARYSNDMCITRYTLAVDRRGAKEGQQQADFISCVAFSGAGQFAEKHFRQGMRVAITGRIQTGSYVNREGRRVYTTDVIIEEQEFADSKKNGDGGRQQEQGSTFGGSDDGFMHIPDGVEDEGLPFN